jgi:hypothetical protein
VAAIGFPLLLAGCGEDTAPPSSPTTEPALGPAARVAAPVVDRFHYQLRQTVANSSFSSFDPSGCVETFVYALGAQQTVKEGPGKPATGPLAAVQVFEYNNCTGETLRAISGQTGDATFEAGQRLTEAHLQATISGFDFTNEVEVQVVVDLVWTGAGELGSRTDRFRLKLPGLTVSESQKGTFRLAQVSGTVTVDGENVATNPIDPIISLTRSGYFLVERTR